MWNNLSGLILDPSQADGTEHDCLRLSLIVRQASPKSRVLYSYVWTADCCDRISDCSIRVYRLVSCQKWRALKTPSATPLH